MTKQSKLWDLCKKFITDNEISCGETVYQCDSGTENSLEFIADMSEIVGFDKEPESKEGAPFIGFSSETLSAQPDASIGDIIKCSKCGENHELEPPDGWKKGDEQPIMLFYKCGDTSYMAALGGKLVTGVRSDFSGNM